MDKLDTSKISVFAKRHVGFLSGLIVVAVMAALYVCAGDSIPVVPTDQLDGEVLCYKLAADDPGSEFYSNFMGGQSSNAMPLSIPGMIFFYLIIPLPYAFSVNLAFVMLVAYLSLYASLRMFGVRDLAAAAVCVCFAFLPFYSVYGLSSMGLPLVICAFQLGVKRKKKLLAVALCLFYTAFSSLVWIGFAVCICSFLLVVYYAFNRNRSAFLASGLIFLAILAGYMAFNVPLIASIAFSDIQGHRAEFVLSEEPFTLKGILAFFVEGHYHSVSNHVFLLLADLVAIISGSVFLFRARRKGDVPLDIVKYTKLVAFGVLLAFIIAVFKVAFHSEFIIQFRDMLPDSLRSFQMDRFYWLYPTLWYTTGGISFELLLRIANRANFNLAPMGWLFIVVVLAFTLVPSIRSNVLVKNVERIAGLDMQGDITWKEFYAQDLFEDIHRDLDALTGGSEYRVLSVGLHPAAAIYNGLSTLDGYSTNYPLSYKHDFAEIIEGELGKSDRLNDYFWGWGSRCYAFSHELGTYYLFSKDDSIAIEDLSINTEAVKDMGGQFIISAVPIKNYQATGLSEIGSYESPSSFYKLWVYQVK